MTAQKQAEAVDGKGKSIPVIHGTTSIRTRLKGRKYQRAVTANSKTARKSTRSQKSLSRSKNKDNSTLSDIEVGLSNAIKSFTQDDKGRTVRNDNFFKPSTANILATSELDIQTEIRVSNDKPVPLLSDTRIVSESEEQMRVWREPDHYKKVTPLQEQGNAAAGKRARGTGIDGSKSEIKQPALSVDVLKVPVSASKRRKEEAMFLLSVIREKSGIRTQRLHHKAVLKAMALALVDGMKPADLPLLNPYDKGNYMKLWNTYASSVSLVMVEYYNKKGLQ